MALGLPWWYLHSDASSGATVDFYPGGSYQISAGSATATGSYSEINATALGGLYEALLGTGAVECLVSLVGGLLAVLTALRLVRNPAMTGIVRAFTMVIAVFGVGSVVAGPVAQPIAFRDSSTGLCPGGLTPNPCTVYWGAATYSGYGVSWGAEIGWYLAAVAAGLSVLALAFWLGAAPDPEPPLELSGSLAELDRLTRLKALLDAGSITPEEFQASKARVLGPVAAPNEPPAAEATSPLEEELAKLQGLHAAGALTDAEYAALRARSLEKV